MTHPARAMPYGDLVAGLEAAMAAGHVASRDCGLGRRLYIYTNRCVYENGWDQFSLLARGLILSPAERRIVATPFPKFFNVGERGTPIPDLPYEVFEKVDGSLGVVHFFKGKWRASTKGAFESSQAAWIENRLEQCDLSALDEETTYLVEAVYPENRIVVHYHAAELVLLAAYTVDGNEIDHDGLLNVAAHVGWRVAKRFSFTSFADLVEHAEQLPVSEEGFVIRYSNGLRLKLKGEEYRRIHRLISDCTPLAIWDAMRTDSDLEAVRRDLPEEFWTDFDSIVRQLSERVDAIRAKVAHVAAQFSGMPDKDVGLQLRSLDPEVQPLIFHWRKSGGELDGRARETLFKLTRPTGNILPGYIPSYAMNRIADEAA